MTEYPRFAAYVVGSSAQPKKRALTWVMKLIEEIYDARYTHDITDLQKEDASTDPAERDSAIFPIFGKIFLPRLTQHHHDASHVPAFAHPHASSPP